MRLIILTQEDPFYLAKNIDFLAKNLNPNDEIAGCVVFNVSPFGKRESFIQKAIKSLRLFGFKFFLRYGFKFLRHKFDKAHSVLHTLKKHNIPRIEIEGSINSKDSLHKLKSLNPDLLVSIAGNQIFKSDLINLAPKGCINLHSALLPKNRGLMPSFWALQKGEKKSGVSVFLVDEGIDSGPIICQEEILIEKRNLEWLILQTKQIGMNLILKSIDKLREGSVDLIANPKSQSTYNSFPNREDILAFKKAGNKFY